MKKIIESQLNRIVENCVYEYLNEGQLNEAWWDKFNFMGNSMAQGAKNMGQKIGNAAQSAGQAMGNAYNNMKQNYQNYQDKMTQYSNAKDNMRVAQKNQQQAQKLYNQIEQFLNLGILNDVAYGKQVKNNAAALMKSLNMLIKSGFKGNATAWENSAQNIKNSKR